MLNSQARTRLLSNALALLTWLYVLNQWRTLDSNASVATLFDELTFAVLVTVVVTFIQMLGIADKDVRELIRILDPLSEELSTGTLVRVNPDHVDGRPSYLLPLSPVRLDPIGGGPKCNKVYSVLTSRTKSLQDLLLSKYYIENLTKTRSQAEHQSRIIAVEQNARNDCVFEAFEALNRGMEIDLLFCSKKEYFDALDSVLDEQYRSELFTNPMLSGLSAKLQKDASGFAKTLLSNQVNIHVFDERERRYSGVALDVHGVRYSPAEYSLPGNDTRWVVRYGAPNYTSSEQREIKTIIIPEKNTEKWSKHNHEHVGVFLALAFLKSVECERKTRGGDTGYRAFSSGDFHTIGDSQKKLPHKHAKFILDVMNQARES